MPGIVHAPSRHGIACSHVLPDPASREGRAATGLAELPAAARGSARPARPEAALERPMYRCGSSRAELPPLYAVRQAFEPEDRVEARRTCPCPAPDRFAV